MVFISSLKAVVKTRRQPNLYKLSFHILFAWEFHFRFKFLGCLLNVTCLVRSFLQSWNFGRFRWTWSNGTCRRNRWCLKLAAGSEVFCVRSPVFTFNLNLWVERDAPAGFRQPVCWSFITCRTSGFTSISRGSTWMSIVTTFWLSQDSYSSSKAKSKRWSIKKSCSPFSMLKRTLPFSLNRAFLAPVRFLVWRPCNR